MTDRDEAAILPGGARRGRGRGRTRERPGRAADLAILGLGTAVPPCAVSQGRAAALTSAVAGHSEAEADALAVLYGLTGIARRHVALLDDGGGVPGAVGGAPEGPSTGWRMRRYEERVGPVALRASADALERAGTAPGAVTHLVTVSCTGFAAPGFDLGLVRDLGLDRTVQRTHVGFMGCHGALNGLRVARALAASEPGSRVLLCAAELCSLHFRYGGGAGQSVTNALFADGAAALVAAPAAEAPAGAGSWRVKACGSVVVPGTEGAMTWRVGDHGFEMTLAPEVPGLIRAHLAGWLGGWLGRHGLRPGDVASWAVHPGGPRVLDAVRDALGLAKAALDDSRAVLASYGNMSSPTVIFILDRLAARQAPRPCVALGFGPGLVAEAVLFA
jgi:predicted naringenin-chalcone synthase